MAKVATSKQTGGGGFDFEDKVSAYFLSKLLSGNYALDTSIGNLTDLAYQVRPDGWLLDDLLLTCNDGKHEHKVAVSAKSNRQITGGGLPVDIMKDVWNQYLNIDHGLFDQANDFLLFIVSSVGKSVSENLTKLIKSAQVTDPAILAKRIRTKSFSKQQRDLFDSFRCPAPWLVSRKLSDTDVCKLLARLIIMEFDFQNTVSKDETQVVAELQGVLRSGRQVDGKKLFDKLKGLRSEIAPHGGSLNYVGLVAKVIDHFDLITQPVYRADWVKISQLTQKKMANIPDKVGGQFSISRPNETKLLTKSLDESRFVFLTGKSGHGKTVIAKHLAEDKITQGRQVIWLDAEVLQHGSFREATGLNHEIDTMIASTNNLGNLIVVDGADRFFKENLIDNLLPFIRLLAALDPVTWKMIITCQIEDYESLLKLLYRKNLPALNSRTVELKSVSKSDLLPATGYFPQLIPLFKHDHLLAILGNLKYLDLIAYHISGTELKPVSGRLGESDLIDWIWQQEITDNGEQGYANSRFLQELAGKQADMLTVYTPITDFSIQESSPIAALKKMKIIGDAADRLFFMHDLFGDWARYKTIRAKGDAVSDFLLTLDLASPLWSKAIRLYGIYLLEKQKNASAWLSIFNGFSNSDSKQKLIRTLLLEAILFSNSTFLYLEELWPEFKKDNGNLMNLFFEQFLIRGTAPDPAMLKLAGVIEGITVSELASLYRLPVYNYWFSVLRFVVQHSADLLQISRGHTLKIATIWLDKVQVGVDYRTDMARIAVEATQWLLEQKDAGVMIYGKAGMAFYDPLLKSYSELPDEVTDLSLKLAGLKKFRKPKPEARIEDRPWHPTPRMGASLVDTKWAPNERVDDDFRNVCLDEHALDDMIVNGPELAVKILLALLIREKGSKESGTTPTYGLKDVHGWFPPFYTRGPFFSFLLHNESFAIEMIVELTNLSAENWEKQLHNGDETNNITLKIDEFEYHYFGDDRIYFWFRDTGNAAHSLVSALMTLEKYLIFKIDKGEDITDAIEVILKTSKSVALIGILSSIGKYKQELFLGILKPLLEEISFYHWEMMLPYSSNVEGHQTIGSELLGLTIAKQAFEWHGMPHRRKGIQQIAQLLFFKQQAIRNFFEETVVPRWIKLRGDMEQEGYLDPYLNNMIGQFNIENYVTVRHEGHITIEYREPVNITEKLQEVRQESNPGGDMSGFAFKISQEIEKSKIYTLNEIDEIWQKIQQAEISADEEIVRFLNDPEANIFASVAVIILNWPLVESQRLNYFNWAIDQLDSATSLEKFDYRHMESDPLQHSAVIFQAITIPLLYKMKPSDPRVRRLVANFTLKASYPVISTLFEAFGKEFSWHDALFLRVQNLYIERCHLVHNLNINVWDSSNVDFDSLLNPPLVDFINNLENRPLTNLAVYRKGKKPKTKIRQKRKHGVYYSTYNDPGLDVHALYYAFSKIPQLSNSLEAEADGFILKFYSTLVDLLTFTWGKITDKMLPLDEYPTEFDKWIAFRLAKLLITDVKPEVAKDFWEPLMVYGNLHHKWLEEFTLQIIYANMSTDKSATLGIHWNAMIDYAFTQKNWGSDKRFNNGASLWDSLLGISNIGIEIWKRGYVAFITTISERLLRWFKKQAADSDQIEKLCQLIKSPAIDLFLKSGLLLVNLHLKFQTKLDDAEVPGGFVRIPFRYNETVASMAAHVWEHRKAEVVRDKNIFGAFKEIVIYLVARQNATGLELQDRLLSMN